MVDIHMEADYNGKWRLYFDDELVGVVDDELVDMKILSEKKQTSGDIRSKLSPIISIEIMDEAVFT